jgi:hypothetical protein
MKSFRKLVQLIGTQSARATQDWSEELGKYLHAGRGSIDGVLYALTLAAMSLVARQRYGDLAVRALRRSVSIETTGRYFFDSAITDLEKVFLKGDSESEGLNLIALSEAAEMVASYAITLRPKPIQTNLDRLVSLMFSDVAATAEEQAARRAETLDRLGSFLSVRLIEHVAAVKHMFADYVIPTLIERAPAKDEPLRMAAPLRVTCAMPQQLSGDSLASAYRIHYEVEQDTVAAPPNLDAGAELHIAPEGAPQAIERVYVHLRHRWYPVATVVTVNRIDVLPPAAFPRLQRHFSVLVEGRLEGSTPPALIHNPPSWPGRAVDTTIAPGPPAGTTIWTGYAQGTTREEAQANLERNRRPYPSVLQLRERPLLISGRKARPPLHLERFMTTTDTH